MADQRAEAPPADPSAARTLAALGLAAGAVAGTSVAASTPARTAEAIADSFLTSAGVLLDAANRLAITRALDFYPDADARALAAELADWSRRYRRQSRARLRSSAADALRLPTKRAELAEVERLVKAARAAGLATARLEARMERVRGSQGQRESALSAALRREARLAGAHSRVNAARGVGGANQLALEKTSPNGAVWVLGPAETHTAGCLLASGRAFPHRVLRLVHPPIHGGCSCRVLPLPKGAAAPSFAASLALMLLVLRRESDHGHEHPALGRVEALAR